MKKFLYSSFLIAVFIFTLIIIFLSTIGIETSKLNNLIIKEIQEKNPRAEIELEKIKIKLDIKNIQLFLSTDNLKIRYQDITIPVTEIKIYSKINKIFNSKIEVSKLIFAIKNFKTEDLQKIAIRIKPSNFKTYLLNNLEGGEIKKASFDLNMDENFKIINYQVNGTIKKVKTKIKNNFIIQDVSFNFKINKNLTLINSINASYEGVLISNGSINLQHKKNIVIQGKFQSNFNLKESQLNKFYTKVKFLKENKIKTEGSLLHEFSFKINKNFKIIDYDYASSGDIFQSQITLKNNLKANFFEKPIKIIFIEKSNLKINYNSKKFKIKHNLIRKNQNYFIDVDLSNNVLLNMINFQGDSRKKSNIKSEFIIKDNSLTFKSINFTEGKNSIFVKGLQLNNKNEIKNLSSIKVLTFNKNKNNNDFIINFEKKNQYHW